MVVVLVARVSLRHGDLLEAALALHGVGRLPVLAAGRVTGQLAS